MNVENLTVAAAAEKIRTYLKRDTLRPYFVVADGMAETDDFKKIFGGLEKIYVSDFCAGDFPLDTDLFIEKLNGLKNDALCFGLGEYIFFTGQEDVLRSLQDRTFTHKIIFFCRGISNLLERLADEDFKFRTNQLCRVVGRDNFSAVKFSPNIKIPTDAKNFSELLQLAEAGKQKITVQTDLPLVNVREIKNFYDAIKNLEPNFSAPPEALDDAKWREYFSDDACDGYPPDHWRTFAAGFKNKIADPYLKFVFARSKNFEAYKKNLFFALLDVDEKIFEKFYELRKAAIKNFSSPHLFEFIEHLKNFPDAAKFLTDNTAAERRAMIEAVQGKEKISDALLKNFPALKDYLSDYEFEDALLTKYFRRYKKIKLTNVNDDDFKNFVRKLATQRPYNRFETRQTLLDRADKNSALYWSDALGVEFLGFIQARANRLGLCATIQVARAELPTLTSVNKNFFDEWRGSKFKKNPQPDEIKHSPEKFSPDGKCSAPTYLDDELLSVDKILEEIQNALTTERAEKIILTSDHGASRPAVMFGRKNIFKMTCAGEHGGRCCPKNFLDEKPPEATEENGWWVLANYDRFAGGRLASVEVHGGATLEEVLVPVVEFQISR